MVIAMSDEAPDPNSRDDMSFEDIEAWLDAKSIPEQVAEFARLVDEAKTELFLANQLALKIAAAVQVGVVNKEEGKVFSRTILQEIKDLQAMLVLQYAGGRTDRETLELLHLIYYPRTRRDGGAAHTLDDNLYHIRGGMAVDVLAKSAGARDGTELKYWEMLRDFLETHPNEPPGWREGLKKRDAFLGRGKKASDKRGTKNKEKKAIGKRVPGKKAARKQAAPKKGARGKNDKKGKG